MIYDKEHYNQVLEVARSYRNDVERLEKQLAITQKALELAVEQLDDAKDMLRESDKHDWAGMIDTSVDYFKARAKEMLKSD